MNTVLVSLYRTISADFAEHFERGKRDVVGGRLEAEFRTGKGFICGQDEVKAGRALALGERDGCDRCSDIGGQCSRQAERCAEQPTQQAFDRCFHGFLLWSEPAVAGSPW